MFIMICPYCGTDCSPKARSCPKCGEPFDITDREVLNELEQVIGVSIPSVTNIEVQDFYVKWEGGTIVGLGLGICRLTVLPAPIFQLKSLQTLDLGGNQLLALPDSFGQLQSLQELYLGANQLTALPDLFGDLKSPIVEVLGLF